MTLLNFPTRSMTISAAAAALASMASVEAFRPIAPVSSRPQLQLSFQKSQNFARSSHSTKKSLTILHRIRCENKYYQLEELEDADNCTTELFLKQDGTVDIGETDGPLFTKATGRWEINENSFAMTITKTFGAGNEKNDMGEFTFDVERVFQGDMTVVGGTEVAINGKIYAEDVITEKMDKEVGFFNMIDGTDLRLERRADARPKDTGVAPSPLNSHTVQGHDGATTDDAQFEAMRATLGSAPPGSREAQPTVQPPAAANSGYGQPPPQQQQQGVSALGGGSFGQDAQGFGGGGSQYGEQQQPASNWGTGSGYGQSQPPQQQSSDGISEYGSGTSFGQASQGYGGGGHGYGQSQQSNDPGPPSFADWGQPQQTEASSNDPGPPSFGDYGQQQEQQPGEDGYYNPDENPPSDGYYDGNYSGGGGLSPMGGGGGGPNPWP